MFFNYLLVGDIMYIDNLYYFIYLILINYYI